MDPLMKMRKDIAQSAATLGDKQAKFLVDSFYTMQQGRIAAESRMRDLSKVGEPIAVMEYAREQQEMLETQLAKALKYYVESQPMGVWMTSILGVGPIIAAGLLSSVDWPNTNTGPRLWSYAGLNPEAKWEKGQKRPWNAFLKTLSFKLGESFVKVQRKDNDFYGKWYAARKGYEWRRNLSGELADQATKRLQNVREKTNAFAWYSGLIRPEWASEAIKAQKSFPLKIPGHAMIDPGETPFPMLPPAHIHSRARRYAVKMFLSHCVEVAHWLNHDMLAPTIFAIAHKGHTDYIYPHNAELVDQLKPGFMLALRDRYGPRYSTVQNPKKTLMYFGEDANEDLLDPESEPVIL